ncbi:hypothetical protein [Actinomadura rupiterrae]|uniref:hypothetical protein n=1 Tax=Actinomadura rupiterrae TaxID=559627 RepID=UPI0020A45FE1|nr:hypothetical protein [Actinomadura rupiterrae]MCP2336207.1 hypothetical protein [Actinomadura rupiterrae]
MEAGALGLARLATQELDALVEIEYGCCHRVNPVVLHPLLPAEWRLDAYRGFLPAQAAIAVRSWRAHLDEVRAGQHDDYLRAWHSYRTRWEFAGDWSELRERAAAARSRTNAWALRPALVETREQILATPVPAVPAAPLWGALPPVPVSLDGLPPLLELAKAWNAAVPGSQKRRVTKPMTFEEFVQRGLDDQWFAECLNWMQQSAAEGYMLLLDW